MPVVTITSSDLLENIEQHFKVSAGPGAGKTYWLTQHIKHVLVNSSRLSKTRKIACITYTNIGVETISGRLGNSAEQVEVSTIHSFLYKHIVKPYAVFIASDYDLSVEHMDGHDEHVVSTKKVIEWVDNHPNNASLTHPFSANQLRSLPNNKKALIQWLETLRYALDDSGDINIESNRRGIIINNRTLGLLEQGFIDYKKLYWKEGVLHHDDVLFFSYQLIRKFPFVLDVLRSKFPYFFIDEFQDSNPIQVAILKAIGQRETIVGVIGDPVQSIYGFQGADFSQFQLFDLPDIAEYWITENRRSTNSIIDLLNHVRRDITQIKARDEAGTKPVIYVGEMSTAFSRAKAVCGDQPVYSLSRDNITSNAMKREINGYSLQDNLFEKLLDTDPPGSGNRYRSRVVIACVKALELARENKFRDAIKELQKVLGEKDKVLGKSLALRGITCLMAKYDEFKDGTIYDFFCIVKTHVKSNISDLRGGNIKNFYEQNSYQQFALCVKIPEDMSFHKTIHKSKGDEFDNVFVVLKREDDLKFSMAPNLSAATDASEEQRINYVAISRSKNRLFISVPSLNSEKHSLLIPFFEIIQL